MKHSHPNIQSLVVLAARCRQLVALTGVCLTTVLDKRFAKAPYRGFEALQIARVPLNVTKGALEDDVSKACGCNKQAELCDRSGFTLRTASKR